jgi:hypothetical protein
VVACWDPSVFGGHAGVERDGGDGGAHFGGAGLWSSGFKGKRLKSYKVIQIADL